MYLSYSVSVHNSLVRTWIDVCYPWSDELAEELVNFVEGGEDEELLPHVLIVDLLEKDPVGELPKDDDAS